MLLPKQKRLIKLIAELGNISQACKKAQINRDTYYTWLKDDEFYKELGKYKNIACENAVSNLEVIFNNAINVYNELVKTDDKALKFRVAGAIINEMPKIIDHKEHRNKMDGHYNA